MAGRGKEAGREILETNLGDRFNVKDKEESRLNSRCLTFVNRINGGVICRDKKDWKKTSIGGENQAVGKFR